MRRALVLVLLLGAAAGSAVADPGCANGGGSQVIGGSAVAQRVLNPEAPYADWTRDATDTVTVSFVADMAKVCADGSYTAPPALPLGLPTTVTIAGEGVACRIDTTSDHDPFGFGSRLHDRGDPACSADVSWGLPVTAGATLGPTGPGSDGVFVVAGRLALASDASVGGVRWGVALDGRRYSVVDPSATLWRGIRVQTGG